MNPNALLSYRHNFVNVYRMNKWNMQRELSNNDRSPAVKLLKETLGNSLLRTAELYPASESLLSVKENYGWSCRRICNQTGEIAKKNSRTARSEQTDGVWIYAPQLNIKN